MTLKELKEKGIKVMTISGARADMILDLFPKNGTKEVLIHKGAGLTYKYNMIKKNLIRCQVICETRGMMAEDWYQVAR